MGAWPIAGFLGLDALGLWLAFRDFVPFGARLRGPSGDAARTVARQVSPRGAPREWRFNPHGCASTAPNTRNSASKLRSVSHGPQRSRFAKLSGPDQKAEVAARPVPALARAPGAAGPVVETGGGAGGRAGSLGAREEDHAPARRHRNPAAARPSDDYERVRAAIEYMTRRSRRAARGRGDRRPCRPVRLAFPSSVQALGRPDAQGFPAGGHHRSCPQPAARQRQRADADLRGRPVGPGRLHDLFVAHEAMTPGDYRRGGEA